MTTDKQEKNMEEAGKFKNLQEWIDDEKSKTIQKNRQNIINRIIDLRGESLKYIGILQKNVKKFSSEPQILFKIKKGVLENLYSQEADEKEKYVVLCENIYFFIEWNDSDRKYILYHFVLPESMTQESVDEIDGFGMNFASVEDELKKARANPEIVSHFQKYLDPVKLEDFEQPIQEKEILLQGRMMGIDEELIGLKS